MTANLLIFAILAVATFDVSASEGTLIQCGSSNFTQGLITKGDTTTRGEWPFLTALYSVEKNMFFCGGTLISSKHVLTAAHCVREKHSNKELLPGDIVVHLGAYDLTSTLERGAQQQNVDEIHIHPEWQAFNEKYDADLAILQLSAIVAFTNYIRPVCVPDHDTAFDDITGSVVGWGLNEINKPNLEFIKRASVTALNGVYCLTKDPSVAVFSSPRTYCSQGENGNGNVGDTGGGFYVLSGSSWMQFGIVSAMRTNVTGHVDLDRIVVYTNVVKFKDWIVDIVNKSGVAVGVANTNVETKINFVCTFAYDTDGIYGCLIDNLNIQSDNTAVASFTGTHLNGKSDKDVEAIVFRNGTMFFIPSQVGEIFKNLKKLKGLGTLVDLAIVQSDLTTLHYATLRDLHLLEGFSLTQSRLTQIDGRAFESNFRLKNVSLDGNKLEMLPRHLFTNNLQLEMVDLHNNSLRIIDETIFQTNAKLKKVWLDGNKLEMLPSHLFTNNLQLELVNLNKNLLKIIDETTFQTNGQLREVHVDGNQLDVLPSHLFTNNLQLELVNLNNNLLKIIDEAIFQKNAELKKVSLGDNMLEALPSHLFTNNMQLELLDLYDNSLEIIDETIFQTNAKLKIVCLGDNMLEALPSHLFTNNLLLEVVHLNNNLLTNIDETIFQTNAKLKNVSLGDNMLEALPSHLFTNNLQLESVNLNRNSLKIIELNFTTLNSIKQIYLIYNKCINAYYDVVNHLTEHSNRIDNLSQLQLMITSNCSSVIR